MRRGDIVLAEVRFADLSAVKIRPALVISSDSVNRGQDRVLVPISSKVNKACQWDVIASPSDTGFKPTGLRCASAFQCAKLITLSSNLIRRKLGTAAPYMSKIESCVKKALGL